MNIKIIKYQKMKQTLMLMASAGRQTISDFDYNV